ncbi:glycosyltransferase family 4 protein [Hominiventricola filiformis]|uniref:Glycosyltransferase family 4 protein n=1 Tax=Hominiventricola filiformis TaxID=2885352 RepID=A0AAE3A857_9FIRM|nr:glycosyltransferase family 4 protein [Hominiventricola filiformis]MCC2125336.1 glycosyltransferase family 4 protein [Hominiventricola filiformis]
MHRFWIFNHYATTPLTGPLLRHYYFAEYLKERNIETTVFAANELHQTGGCVDTHGKPYLRTEEEGVPFVFVKTSKYEGNGISRVKNMVSFFLGLLKISKGYAKQYGKPDVIMGSSAHPLTSIAGILVARRFRVPAIVEVRDLWPEAIFSFGKVKMNSLVGRLLSAGEKWMYVHADAIVFTKEGDVDHIKEMGWDKDHGGKIDLAKCHYINNGVNLKDYYASIEKDILKDPDLEDDSFKVVYTGTVRPVNNVGNLLDTAKLLKDKKDIKFLIFGGGSELEKLEKRVQDEHIDNVIFKGFVEKKYIPYILSRSSVNVLNYSQANYNWSRGNSSNKLFEYMASGKPIISTVKMGYCILDKYQCGLSLEECTAKALAEQILKIHDMPEEAYAQMAENAKNGAKDFDFPVLTRKLYQVIKSVEKD